MGGGRAGAEELRSAWVLGGQPGLALLRFHPETGAKRDRENIEEQRHGGVESLRDRTGQKERQPERKRGKQRAVKALVRGWGWWRGRKFGREQEGVSWTDEKQKDDQREVKGGREREKSRAMEQGRRNRWGQAGPAGQESRYGRNTSAGPQTKGIACFHID